MGIVNLHPVTDVDAIDTVAVAPLGHIYYSVDITTAGTQTSNSVTQPIYTINVYRYVKFIDITHAAGYLCLWADLNLQSVTGDVSGGNPISGNWAAGFAQAANTAGTFGYIKILGRQTGVVMADTGTAIVIGSMVCSHASVDGSVDHITDVIDASSAATLETSVPLALRGFAGMAMTTLSGGSSGSVFVNPNLRLF